MKQIITSLLLFVSMVTYGQSQIYLPKEVKCGRYVYFQTNDGETMSYVFESPSVVKEIYIDILNEKEKTILLKIDDDFYNTDIIVVNNSTDVTQYVLRFEDKQFTLDVIDNRYFRLLAFINDDELLYTGLLD